MCMIVKDRINVNITRFEFNIIEISNHFRLLDVQLCTILIAILPANKKSNLI